MNWEIKTTRVSTGKGSVVRAGCSGESDLSPGGQGGLGAPKGRRGRVFPGGCWLRSWVRDNEAGPHRLCDWRGEHIWLFPVGPGLEEEAKALKAREAGSS